MPKIQLYTTDIKMLELAEYLQATGRIRYLQEFWDEIDINKRCLSNIRRGKQHFTITHLSNAHKAYGVSPNWLFGVTQYKWVRIKR